MAASGDTSPDGSRTWDGLSPEMTAKILAMQSPASTPAPRATPVTKSMAAYTVDDYLKQNKPAAPSNSYTVDSFLKNKAPTVNPAQMGQTSTGNYTNTMQQQGYQPMADQAGNAYLEGQRAGTNFNLDVAKSQFEKAQSEGQTATQLQLPKDIQDKVLQYQNAFKAIDNVEDHYSQALKSPYFGGNFRGGTPFAALAGQTDDRVKQYTTAAELAATPIANGVLNYTQGADSKAAVIEKINDILPNSRDAFQTGSGKLNQLRNMTLTNLVNMKNEVSKAANYNTQPIDDAINQWAPKVQENNQWMQKTFPQPNANPQNPNSSFSADAQAQLDKVFNKPQPSPVSQFSPVGGQTPMPAAQQPVPGL